VCHLIFAVLEEKVSKRARARILRHGPGEIVFDLRHWQFPSEHVLAFFGTVYVQQYPHFEVWAFPSEHVLAFFGTAPSASCCA
jgi:hypothetical protein